MTNFDYVTMTNICATTTETYKKSLENYIQKIEDKIGFVDNILLSQPSDPHDSDNFVIDRIKEIKESHQELIANSRIMCAKIESTENLLEKMYLIIIQMGIFSSYNQW